MNYQFATEIEIIHLCVPVPLEGVVTFIEQTSPEVINFVREDIEYVQADGMPPKWWYVILKVGGSTEIEKYISQIQLKSTWIEGDECTKITMKCSKHPRLNSIFTDLSYKLHQRFGGKESEVALVSSGAPIIFSRFVIVNESDLFSSNEEELPSEKFPRVGYDLTSSPLNLLEIPPGGENLPDPNEVVEKYGTERNLTKAAIREHVKRCRHYQNQGGTVKNYHNTLGNSPPFSLETLKSYLKDPRFSPDECGDNDTK